MYSWKKKLLTSSTCNREAVLLFFTFELFKKCNNSSQTDGWSDDLRISLGSNYLFLCFDIFGLAVPNWSRTRFLLLAPHDGTLREQNIGWTCVNSVEQTAGRKGVDVRGSHVFEMRRQVLQNVYFSLCALKHSQRHIFVIAIKVIFFLHRSITHAQIVSSVSVAGAEHLPYPPSDRQSPDPGMAPSWPHCPPVPRHQSPSEKNPESHQGKLNIKWTVQQS